jgi:flagellar hook-associated protein 2
MSTIQFGGVVSGLNTQGIIDALVAVKKQPLTQLQNKEATLQSQKAAYSQVGTAIDDLVNKIKNFTVTSAGASRVATPADASVFTATAVRGSASSQYQVSVDHLATATKAVSTTSLGAPVTGSVDTSLMLNKANLATPITAGNMAITVDGATVQFTVGNPATTSLQTVMNGLASALQAQIQAQGDTATVAASIVDGQIRLSVSDNAVAHDISFGDVADTSNLKTAFGLGTQGVTGVQNATITGTSYLDPVLSSLNLPGSVTAGQISAIVDGQIVHYTVGDPTKTTLTQTLKGFAAALQAQLRSGGSNADPDLTATVNATVVGNKLNIAVTGAGLTHSLRFGAAGDASNALGMFGIANSSVVGALNPTITGATNLGVARMTGALDSAGLTGLTSTTTGKLTINGVDVTYNTTSDTLSSIISRINNSSAGVIASIDRTNDQLVLTRKDTGAVAIDIQDTSGNLGAALKLAPGTTNAQLIGDTAQVTVDGRTVISTSNTVTNAIDGVTLNLLKRSPLGEAQTLTVGVDSSAVTASLNSFITSFNSLGDTLDRLTATTPGQAGGTAGSAGPLANDPTARSMFLSLRDTLFRAVGSGSLSSLGQLGISTGAVGALAGSTNRIQLDTNALTIALNLDAGKVASLLDSSTGPLSAVLDKLKTYEDPANKYAYIQAHTAGLTSEISDLQRQELERQTMINNYQSMIEAQYAAMEATLAQLQSQSSQIASQLGQSSSSSGSGLGNSSTNR